MSYSYLFELYQLIDQRLTLTGQLISELPQNSEEIRFLDGKRDVLVELKDHLEKNLNPKLPRAIARKLENESNKK